MCGRFALRLPRHVIRQVPGHDVDVDEWMDENQFEPRYNIAPRTQGAVLRRRDPGPSGSGSTDASNADASDNQSRGPQYILQSMKWGLVPNWSKFEDKTLSTTNARSENLVEGGGMWASIKGKKRCAVVCQGYYEWLNRGKDKLPHFTKHRDGKLMLMAGLYDCVTLQGESTPLWTFTIVTTSANSEFSWLHERQPHDALDTWLDTSSQTWTPALTKLVEPYHDLTSPLECYQVPKEVGKVGTESATFIEPVSNRKDGIQAMFSKQKQSQKHDTKPSFKPSSQSHATTSQRPLTLKRSRSPGVASPSKKHKVDKSEPKVTKSGPSVNKSESPDPDIIILSTPPKKKAQRLPQRSPAKGQSPKKKSDVSSAKITAFFNKT